MSKSVGIPKALLYYNFYPMWKTFFEEIGANVVVSQNTNKKIIDDGIKCCVDEACLPVKTYVGHVIDLKEKGVDYIFIPRIISVENKKYLCPKFLGLPDFVKSVVPDLPEVIDMEINLYKNDKSLNKEFTRIGKKFIKDEKKIFMAYFKSLEAQNKFECIMRRGFSPNEAIKILEGKTVNAKNKDNSIKIALLAHSYDIMDEYISFGVIEKLREMGAKVYTTEMLEKENILYGASMLSKDLFWTYGRDIIGAGKYFLERKNIDGVIVLSAFGCGPDSLTGDLLERDYKRSGNIPFMSLTIDEHTGEAGIMTRLEAFIDLLKLRKKGVLV